MSMPDKERMRNDVVMNDRFNRGLARKARKGDRNSQILLANIQSGAVDFTGSFGIRNANQDRDLNIGQNRVDVKNQGMWADQGAGDIPEPGQAPKAAEPQRQVNPNSKLGAGNGYAGKGQKSNGKSIQNPGPPAARAELANGTLQEQQEAIDNGGMEPSATRPAATPSARQGESGNGPPAAPADSSRKTGPNGAPETDFEMMDREARERIDGERGWGKPKIKFALKAQEEFKSDLDKSVLISKGRAYEGDLSEAEVEETKAAQEKALKRGESLGGNREELQKLIGMETDAQAIERKAGEKSMSEKEASNQRIAKIEAGLKKTGDKAANDYLADNRDSFESIDSSISKAKEIRDGVGKDEAGKALYSESDREAIVINESKQKDKLAMMKAEQSAGSRDKELGSLAADEIIKARKEITDNLSSAHSDSASSIFTANPFGANPSSAFSGRSYEGDWINDSSQGIMPDQKFLRENADNPEAIKGKIRANIGNRQAVDTAFNAELGGTSEKAVVSLSAEEKSNSKNPFQTGKEVGFETDGFGKVKKQALDSTARYSEKLESIDKILTAASKTGYPVWQDKELMADVNFKKKVMANPSLKQKFEQAEQSQKTLQAVQSATVVTQKVKDQDTWFNG